MTPEEQAELDTLKQELRQTDKLLQDAKGRIKAVELDNYETKRNAKIATEQAEALKAETENSLATAAEQLKIAHAIGCGIYGMAELGRAFMARKTTAARMVFREDKTCELLQRFVDSTERNDTSALKITADQAKQRLASIKSDGEAARTKAFEYALAYGFKDFEKTFNELLKAGD